MIHLMKMMKSKLNGKKRKNDLSVKELPKSQVLPGKSVFRDEYSNEGRRTMQSQLRSLTAYDRHKLLINEYFLSFPGATRLLKRDQLRNSKLQLIFHKIYFINLF